jgi:phage tail tube protein FII
MFFKKKKENNINENFNHTKMLEIFSDIEVDPIAEADVYFSYGRDKQAIEILNEALKKGKISKEKYENFINSHSKKIKDDEIKKEMNVVNYLYYISITYIFLSKTYKKRFEISLSNIIETKKGVQELEQKVKEEIQTDDWSLDSFIKIID